MDELSIPKNKNNLEIQTKQVNHYKKTRKPEKTKTKTYDPLIIMY